MLFSFYYDYQYGVVVRVNRTIIITSLVIVWMQTIWSAFAFGKTKWALSEALAGDSKLSKTATLYLFFLAIVIMTSCESGVVH